MKHLINTCHKRIKESQLIQGLIFTLLTWGIFFIWLWPKMLYKTKDGIFAGCGGVWSDWPTHFAYASKVAYCPINLWFQSHPFYYDFKPRHHFAANIIPGLLMRAGINEINSFIIPSIITTLLLLITIYFFYYKELCSAKQAFIALTLFLCSGGLGFKWFLEDLIKSPTLETLTFPPRQYTTVDSIYYNNFVTSELIPQRAFLLGLPLALILILILQHWIKNNFRNITRVQLFLLGCCSSILTIVHIYSFIGLIIIYFVYFAFDYIISGRNLDKWLALYSGITISFLLFFYKQFAFNKNITSTFFQWCPGCFGEMNKNNINFFQFWTSNWGTFFLMAIASIILMRLYKQPLIQSGIILFVISNLFLISPWHWNNHKLLSWSYLLLCIPVTSCLNIIWGKNKMIFKLTAFILFITLVFSGAIDIYRLTKTNKLSTRIWSTSEINLAKEFIKISRPSDRVLTAPTHNHWVMTLTGRQIILGYTGKLWSWGINTKNTLSDVNNIYSGTEHTDKLLKQYDLKYVVFCPVALSRFHANENYFIDRYPVVLQNNEYRVYKILHSY